MADTWPPEQFDKAFARWNELDAWWAGDVERLSQVYGGQASTHTVSGMPHAGGVVGRLRKWWWGQPVAANEDRMKMHLPLAADLCALSADLLFSEAPQLLFRKPEDAASTDTTPEAEAASASKWQHPQQARLDQLIGSDEAHAELLMAGEMSAALGATYLSVAWDAEVADSVFPKAYAADVAIPQFRLGRLVGVKLWSEYRDGNIIFRLIEEHGRGWISYTLFKGSSRTLGKAVSVLERSETAYLANLRVPADSGPTAEFSETISIATGSDRLAVVYMRNAMPVRDWRKDGDLAHLGRSDLDGVQDILDKIDQTWSSLMRDIDNGAGRLVVPEHFLELSGKPGEGAKFDMNRQVYSPVNALGGAQDSVSSQITIAQFEIRVEEHLAVIDGLKREIASAVGYSPTHLGLKDAAGTKTATEVDADLSDSERTRDRKALYAKPALAAWARTALEIDSQVFGKKPLVIDELPDVVFAPVSQADPEKTARTVQLLDAARAASRKVIVQTLHPDWDDEDVAAEVTAILEEFQPVAIPDPYSFNPEDDDDEDPETDPSAADRGSDHPPTVRS